MPDPAARWRVACDCGYTVVDLTAEQANRYAEHHRDDDHSPAIEAQTGAAEGDADG